MPDAGPSAGLTAEQEWSTSHKACTDPRNSAQPHPTPPVCPLRQESHSTRTERSAAGRPLPPPTSALATPRPRRPRLGGAVPRTPGPGPERDGPADAAARTGHPLGSAALRSGPARGAVGAACPRPLGLASWPPRPHSFSLEDSLPQRVGNSLRRHRDSREGQELHLPGIRPKH